MRRRWRLRLSTTRDCLPTLTSSRKVFLQLTHGFDTVLIDEAAQANEMATLIPFLHGARRCVLVGDPQQLRPRHLEMPQQVSSSVRSLNASPSSVPRRCCSPCSTAPDSSFPARSSTRADSWTLHVLSNEGQNRISKRSRGSARIAFLTRTVSRSGQPPTRSSTTSRPSWSFATTRSSIRCSETARARARRARCRLSPCTEQVTVIRKAFEQRRRGRGVATRVQINTIDGYRARSDVIIFSTVRGSGDGGIGFLSDSAA